MLLPGCQCCGASFPCSCSCSCDVTVVVEGNEVKNSEYSGTNPHPECDYFTGVFRICVVDNTDAASLADGYDKVLVTALFSIACSDSSDPPWDLQVQRYVAGLNSTTCDQKPGELKTEFYSWNCGEDGCPTGEAILIRTEPQTNDPAPPQSWLDEPCYANTPAITMDCNPLP